ncbi:hypothetical protein [Lacrimispora indolis]|uniref:hypothetical protein n=1 Tax=Lacrimispora indolis TaxID=69825 RepID=UPI00045EBE4A|nr:hypothetical protein [Lacrimispora indolis]MBE7718808.1 hypothetical protein [Lacrimispora celerecrescens]
MSLKEFYSKEVNIVDVSGKHWSGVAEDYCFPDENESGNESLIVRCNARLIEFETVDIETINTV